MPIGHAQKMVRMETKRGCPYECNFCAHRDLTQKKLYKKDIDRALTELDLFHNHKVAKVNILDPIFNAGGSHIEILKELSSMQFSPMLSLQCRFEILTEEFLDLCEKLHVKLEFGLQTAIEAESQAVKRKNNMKKVAQSMERLQKRGIDYEVSLIYGLPLQTLASFQESIDFVLHHGQAPILAFPLMLLKGTELYEKRHEYGFIENTQGNYKIPIVTASNSFSESDWLKMEEIALSLQNNVSFQRIR
jgi:radical SAM superfamily enzyme YgiQ (UPF0313 family)